MIEDKISIVLKELATLKEKLKEVKKDMKQEEKLTNQEYVDLKVAIKDLKGQKKEMEEQHMEGFKSDDFYNSLRELKMQTEEKLAQSQEELFKLIANLPQKHFSINLETDYGSVKVDVQPEMRVYLNGREEKPR